MSSSSDNPLVRFTAFWWAFGVFALFAVLLLSLKAYTAWFGDSTGNDPLEEAAAVKRYEVASTVKSAQSANLAFKAVEPGKIVQVPPGVIFDHVGAQLLAAKPEAVKKPEQMVPGGVAAAAVADTPSADFDAVNKLTPPADTPVDPAVMEVGKASFMVCMACHGANGEGGPIAPPLAGSDWVTGPVSNLVLIQLRGLIGPLTVSGKPYNLPAPMAPLAYQTDDQVAAVLTYVRNSFGNKASPVLPEQVKMLRSEVGKPFLTEAELIKPTP